MIDFINFKQRDYPKLPTAEFGLVTCATARWIEDREDIYPIPYDKRGEVIQKYLPQYFSYVMYEFDRDMYIFAVPPLGLLIKLIYKIRARYVRILFFLRDFGFISNYVSGDSILEYKWKWTCNARQEIRTRESTRGQQIWQTARNHGYELGREIGYEEGVAEVKQAMTDQFMKLFGRDPFSDISGVE